MANSPSPISPRLGNSNSIFFASGGTDGIADKSHVLKGASSIANRNQGQSPSPIKITIDHAEDPPKEELDLENVVRGKKTRPTPGQNNSKKRTLNAKDSKTDSDGMTKRGSSRKSRKDIHDIATAFRRRNITEYVGRYYEPDRDLIRRQQAMIAVQPMTGLEEINYKRDMLRMKVEHRRRAEAFMTPRSGATTSFGTLLASSKSQPGSRSPSRSPSRSSMNKAQSDFDISKKLADSTSHAIRVTKKVSNLKEKLTPKIVNQAAVISKK